MLEVAALPAPAASSAKLLYLTWYAALCIQTALTGYVLNYQGL